MNVIPTRLPEVLIVEPKLYPDARGFFAELRQPGMDPLLVPGAPYKLSQTPWQIRSPAPCLGQHTDAVLSQQLGLSVTDLKQLRDEQVI